ncbi:MOSC N-terminal beta barrel domain-containing protein [Streptomyces sp. NPDC049954]|uniref:MOSC domain-containing protein n=1 Tax=Streptomyces sp. NPDC049954 TaxID=3155779 RepID=UPI003434B862
MAGPVLHSVHIHPLKAARALDREAVLVERWGLAGDRRWMLVDPDGKLITQREEPRLALLTAAPRADGSLVLSAPGAEPLAVTVPEPVATVPVRVFRTKVEAVLAAESASTWCGAYLGRPVRLVHLDDPAVRRPIDPAYARPGETVSFADGYPLLLATTASLDALNSLISQGDLPDEGPVPMSRFRPNLVIEGTEPWAEDGWWRIRVGEVLFRVPKPCSRCIVTTTDQLSARRGKEPLRSLARHRRSPGNGALFGTNLIPESSGTVRVGDALTVLERATPPVFA